MSFLICNNSYLAVSLGLQSMPQSVLHHRTREKQQRKHLILYQPELVFMTLLAPILELYLLSVTVLLPSFTSIATNYPGHACPRKGNKKTLLESHEMLGNLQPKLKSPAPSSYSSTSVEIRKANTCSQLALSKNTHPVTVTRICSLCFPSLHLRHRTIASKNLSFRAAPPVSLFLTQRRQHRSTLPMQYPQL